MENSIFSIAPKTSLVDRTGVKVPPLPTRKYSPQSTHSGLHIPPTPPNAPGGNGNANRSRSRSISSVARDRTYAARDVSQMRDPGEALVVPEEEDEDDFIPIEHGINEADKGRLNAYKILARQTDTPDETMWRSVAG